MKKFNKILSLVLVLAMMLGLVACGGKSEAPAATEAPAAQTEAAAPAAVYVDPYADIADDYDALSEAVYMDVLGEFNAYYEEALAESNVSKSRALMAIAEAKLLGAGIFLPTTSQGGNFAVTRVAPYTNTPVLFGNDEYRFHDRIVTTEPIEAAHYNEMKAKWAELAGTGTYEQYVRDYLAEKGYTIKTEHVAYFDANVQIWDVLATSYAADSEILVNCYDGLVEYDMENVAQPALSTGYTVSEDGLKYTFTIREGAVWVDNQGREVGKVTADNWVAGMQHVCDAAGGLEYLLGAGFANIVNADAYVAGEVTDFAEVGVKAIDDYTLEYTLDKPTNYFPTMLSYGVFAPLCREYYESLGGKFGDEFKADDPNYKYGKGPDSIAYNGPFRITNYADNNIVAYEANTTYWNADGNNINKLTFFYTDGSDHQKMYDDFFTGVIDSVGLTTERVQIAREKGTFDTYAYIADTNATTYCGFFNLRRAAFANYNDANVGISPKTEEDVVRTGAAMLNKNFRLALATSMDRATYNEQSVGSELKLNNLCNSYTPGTFVSLEEDTTVSINGTDKTYPKGTFYGQIMQDQLDADGIALTVWNGQSSSGFDGWYNPEACKGYIAAAVEELAAIGIEVSAANPIYLDFPVRTDSTVNMNQKQALKKSIEAATDGLVIVNLVEYVTRDEYLAATYRFNVGNEANYDFNDGSGWGPDYGDPSTYLGTMLPYGAGYMTKSLGIF